MISPENLFRAWKVFKENKRNKVDVMEFEINLEKEIFKLHRELKDRTYHHGPYSGFWIRDPKLRRIHKATVRDRVLHHAVFRILNPIFEPTFIANSFSCRIGKGTHKGMRKVAEMIRAKSGNYTRECFALKCDIRKFFDSIDHDILLRILEKKVVDKRMLWLLREIIESFTASRPNLFDRHGVPIGNLTSQIFANIYMNEFDQFIKHALHVKDYARYTDDFVIISNDRKYLEYLLEPIREYLSHTLHIELHPHKILLRECKRGIDFLGYVILPHHIVVRKKTKQRVLRKLRERVAQYRNGNIKEETLWGSLSSYLGVLSHADAYKLTEETLNNFWFWLKE